MITDENWESLKKLNNAYEKKRDLAVEILQALIDEMIEKQQPITISDKLFDHLMDWKNGDSWR